MIAIAWYTWIEWFDIEQHNRIDWRFYEGINSQSKKTKEQIEHLTAHRSFHLFLSFHIRRTRIECVSFSLFWSTNFRHFLLYCDLDEYVRKNKTILFYIEHVYSMIWNKPRKNRLANECKVNLLFSSSKRQKNNNPRILIPPKIKLIFIIFIYSVERTREVKNKCDLFFIQSTKAYRIQCKV